METEIIQILNGFEPILLSQMESVKLMKRMDTKFAFPAFLLPEILIHLKKDYKVFEHSYVRLHDYLSHYYDNEELTFYHNHHRRKMHRFKVRHRSYLDSNKHYFEVKERWKGRTNKQRIEVPKVNSTKLSDAEADFLHQFPFHRRDLELIISNKFQRITLVNQEHQERLTLDLNIEFEASGAAIHDPVIESLVVAELKQKRINRSSPFFQLMKDHHIRPYRLSKYCMGVMAMQPDGIKVNRFKKKYLTLNKIARHVSTHRANWTSAQHI